MMIWVCELSFVFFHGELPGVVGAGVGFGREGRLLVFSGGTNDDYDDHDGTRI